ncbi:nitroreductase family protein [Hydrogenophaga sp. BPS33]|uniref:nitroreductase family protein n=1 Tax=Hydrogenophaga sp. BPS33 TaxID=2651974 RepID=UPI00131FE73F|nr:nitroreductase family protein [Hydrogenophaga sp. BPS33]QHE88263.1 NADPH-dependent oxidoreductase [Hydrogenophaga sp. BPS33]
MAMTTADLQALLHARYGAAAPTPQTAADNPVIHALLQHRSVRSYTPAPVSDDVLQLMLAAAQSASTSSNLQCWSVVAVRDAERKQRLSALAGDQRHIKECPLYLVWLVDLARLETTGERFGLRREALDYLEMLMVGVIDATLAAQNAAVAAEAQGLGIVYIGGMRDRPEAVAAELGLPPRTAAVFGMCVGYPDHARPTSIKPRLPGTAVLHHERYDTSAHLGPVDDYLQIANAFYQAQQMKTNGNWAEHSLHRVRGPEAMRGRERLASALQALGFPSR